MVLTALLFSMAPILSFVEGQIPVPLPVPGIQPGLLNIAVMYSLFFVRKRQALTPVILKSLFAFLTRGAAAFFARFRERLHTIPRPLPGRGDQNRSPSYSPSSMEALAKASNRQPSSVRTSATGKALVYSQPAATRASRSSKVSSPTG